MGFRVGDKVKVVDMLRPSESFEVGETGKVVGIYEYCNNFPISVRMDKDKEVIDFSKEELELYKEDKMEKTFQEVIRDIKEGEVWECVMNKNITIDSVGVELDSLDWTNMMLLPLQAKFKPKRKKYTFQEAFAAYEEGKEIESIITGIKCQKRRLPYETEVKDCCYYNDELKDIGMLREFTINEIRGSWYINE